MNQNKENVILSSEIAVGKVAIESIRPLIACICMSVIAVVLWILIPVIGIFIAIIPGLLSWLFLILAIVPIISACKTHINVTDRGVYGKDGHNTFDFTYDQIKAVNYKKKGKKLIIKYKVPENTPNPDKIRTVYSLDPLKNGQELYEQIKSFLPVNNSDEASEEINEDEEF